MLILVCGHLSRKINKQKVSVPTPKCGKNKTSKRKDQNAKIPGISDTNYQNFLKFRWSSPPKLFFILFMYIL